MSGENDVAGKTLMEKWMDCMRKENWTFVPDVERSQIVMFTTSKDACLKSMFSIKERAEQVIYTVNFERRCPSKYRKTMAEYCCHVNDILSIGFLAIDMNDGEIRFRHSCDLEGTYPTPKFVDNFIKAGVQAGRKFYKSIEAIMWGYSLEKAIAMEDEPDDD